MKTPLLILTATTLFAGFSLFHISQDTEDYEVHDGRALTKKSVEPTLAIAKLSEETLQYAAADFLYAELKARPAAEKLVTEARLEKYHTETVSWKSSCGGGCCGGYYETIEVLQPSLVSVNTEISMLTERTMEEPTFQWPDYEVKLYPNPFREQATIEINHYDDEPYAFEIFDLTGRMVSRFESQTSARLTIPRSDMRSGVYIYRLYTHSETQVHSGKFVVQ